MNRRQVLIGTQRASSGFMKILVTGGTGVLGVGSVTALLSRGHTVVVLSRHAKDDAAQWSEGVTARDGNVAKPESIVGAAKGCDVVLHMVGIVDESGPDITFEKINVQGTANLLAEANRSGVRRFVYVSSLGAPGGESEYHASKRRAEELVRAFDGEWTICRPGNVYGPGDDQISVLLRMVRGVTPFVPTVGDGEQRFQPLWWEDAAEAMATMCERDDLTHRELDLAGTEITTQRDLMERFGAITGKSTRGVPVPEFLALLGAKAVSLVGWNVPLSESQIQMIREENIIAPEGTNALTDVLGIRPTPLDDGLRALADQQPEQLPDEGVGSLRRKRFWADIANCHQTPESLFAFFRAHFNEVMPVFVDGSPTAEDARHLEEGDSLTLSLPMRGHVQVRVAGVEERQMTLLTLQGHPLAGAVRFLCGARGDAVCFQVEVYDRAANMVDFIAMRTLGDMLQTHTWTHVVESVIEASGGTAPDGVQHERQALDDAEADAIHDWLEKITVERKRNANDERIAGVA